MAPARARRSRRSLSPGRHRRGSSRRRAGRKFAPPYWRPPPWCKARHRICAGGVRSSRSRSTRCVSTCVLPLPALAETQAEVLGFEARACRSRSGSGMARRPAHGATPDFVLAAGRGPFLDARKMVVVGETAGEFRERAREIGGLLAGELVEEDLEFGEMLLGEGAISSLLPAAGFSSPPLGAAEFEIERLLGFERAAAPRIRLAAASRPPASIEAQTPPRPR